MSLYGALFTGISGLTANSNALSATSNNIANVNTIGYKSDSALFSTLLDTQSGNNTFSSGGVQANLVQNVNQQGLIQQATASTDLAISGNGFFITTNSNDPANNPGQTMYTRAGAFAPDANGLLRNASGLYLLGWQLDSAGNLPPNPSSLVPINLNNLTGTAQPTTQMNLQANLQSSQAISAAAATYDPTVAATSMAAYDPVAGTGVQPDFQRTVQVYDTQGGAQQLDLDFLKTGANTWAYEVAYDGSASNLSTATTQIASGTLTFNADGTIASVTPTGGSALATGTAPITVPFSFANSGLNPQDIALNFGTLNQVGGVTQFDSPSTVSSSGADGALFGALSGVTVDDTGKVIAVFDNGVQRPVYQLPIATFANPNGLTATNGNAYLQSQDSGDANYTAAKTGGAGSIASLALESSTVDLGTEFTNLITVQRAYSASSRIITTADEMLQELMQIKR